MRSAGGGGSGAAKNQGRPSSSTNGGGGNTRKGAAATPAIAINNKNASRAANNNNKNKAPPSSSSPVSYAAKLSSSGGSSSAAGSSPNRRPSTAPGAAPAKRDNAASTTATTAARPASKSPSSSLSLSSSWAGGVGGGGSGEEDVRAWLHARLESTFGLDASVYGSYLEGFLQSEPSTGTTSDDARDAIREVLLAAALDQEGLVEEFIDQLMQRWADRPKGAAKVTNGGAGSYSAAVSPPATTGVTAAQQSSKQAASSKRKTKPQPIAPSKVPPSGAIGQSAARTRASFSEADTPASSFPAGYFGVGNLNSMDDDDLLNEKEDEEMRLHTESMVSALLGDDFGGAGRPGGLGDAGLDDPDGLMMMVGSLSLEDCGGIDDDDDDVEGDDHTHHGNGLYYGGFGMGTVDQGNAVFASPFAAASPSSSGFLAFGGGGSALPSSSPVQFVDFSSSSFSSPPRSPPPSSSSFTSAKDEAFEMLVSMFNDYEREGLQQLFDANDRDMERTVAILLEIEREEGESNPAAATAHARGYEKGASAIGGGASGAPSAKGVPVDIKQLQKMPDVVAPPNANNIVCRYYLKGKCFRADCWYSHDLRAVTCKYWMAGECLKGDICEFRHGYDPQQLQSRTQKITVDYATSFPSLPSSSPSPSPSPLLSPSPSAAAFPSPYAAHSQPAAAKHSPSKQAFFAYSDVGAPPPATSASGGEMNMAQRLKLQKLQEEFQDLVEEKAVVDVFHQAGLSYETAKARLLARHPDLAARKQERDRERERERLRQQNKQTSQAAQQKKLTEIIKGLKKKNKVGWVETGESVGEQYSSLREQAIEHARMRNKLFQEATQAYLVGNKSAATQLSAQGRFHHKKMEELHEQASQQIFLSRNSSHPDVLDLHGLHVDEALSILDTFLYKQERELVEGSSAVPHQLSRHNKSSAAAAATGLYNASSSSSSSSSSFSSSSTSSTPSSSSSSAASSSSASSNGGSGSGFKLVYVITGTGHHSQTKKARLQPAVQKFLAERGYACADTSPDGRGGMLTVTVLAPSPTTTNSSVIKP